MADNVLMTITPSPLRRVVSVIMLVSLGGVLIYLAAAPQISTLIWKLVTVGIGASTFIVAVWVWQATVVSVELTDQELRESDGRVLCTIERIASVDRGAFAFKPSNGLLIRLSEPDTNVWAPGLWWRYGKRIGLGGVTNAGEVKAMEEMIKLKLANRSAEKVADQN